MIIALDVETTKAPNHFPWCENSALVSVHISHKDWDRTWLFNHDQAPADTSHRDNISEIVDVLSRATLVVGHNIKFDILWLNHIGINTDGVSLFCTMVAEYLAEHQKPSDGLSLNELCQKYGVPLKHDLVKEYWQAGIDTPQIPLEILVPYGEQDTRNALVVYSIVSKRLVEQGLIKLFQLEMEALKAFADMEYNGMLLDVPRLVTYAEEYGEKLEVIEAELTGMLGIHNVGSPEQLSVGLFGGRYTYPARETYLFHYKDPKKPPAEKERTVDREVVLAGLFDPKKFGVKETKKIGVYTTNVDALKSLKASNKQQKRILELLHEHSRLAQMKSTYFDGLVKHVDADGFAHGSLNQTIARTGRMSCSRPNMQNQPRGNTGPVKECFLTRF